MFTFADSGEAIMGFQRGEEPAHNMHPYGIIVILITN